MFTHTAVINLERRPEMYEQFQESIGSDWPFRKPKRHQAVDGYAHQPNAENPGAWGCWQSHINVLSYAISTGVQTLLVLEDDARPVPNFTSAWQTFHSQLPPDADAVMLGGEHTLMPMPINGAVVQCLWTIRTHAYALFGERTINRVYEALTAPRGNEVHVDGRLASTLTRMNTYAPRDWMFTQVSHPSDIQESTGLTV